MEWGFGGSPLASLSPLLSLLSSFFLHAFRSPHSRLESLFTSYVDEEWNSEASERKSET